MEPLILDDHDGLSDDLDTYETASRRFLRWAAPAIGVAVAIALVIPLGSGIIAWLGFSRAGDRVVEELTAADLDASLVASVLLVGATDCRTGRSVTGTAFAFDHDGGTVVVTNRHVVDDVALVGLRTLRGNPGPEVVSWRLSDLGDVAILDLADIRDAPPALVAARTMARVGEPVRTVGFPYGSPFTSGGDVSAVEGSRAVFSTEVDPGASGSPVLDADGLVVGQVYAQDADGRAVGTPLDPLLAAIDAVGAPIDSCVG